MTEEAISPSQPESRSSDPAKLCSSDYGLRWSGLTHVGRYRKNNEDAFLCLVFDSLQVNYLGKIGSADFSIGDFVFAVSDGMGGANAGEYASRIVVDKITKLLPRSFKMGARGLHQGAGDVLEALVQETHDAMDMMGRNYEEVQGMGATLSLCWFHPGWLHFIHVGDSRIYYLPASGGLKQMTHDHSYVGRLLRDGKINEREARNHPQRHQIEQVVGGRHQKLEPQLGSIGYEIGDRFVICSDGVLDGLWDNGIEKVVRNPMPWLKDLPPAEALVKESLSESGRDNITAIVVEIISSELAENSR